jgi:hypothetical protein
MAAAQCSQMAAAQCSQMAAAQCSQMAAAQCSQMAAAQYAYAEQHIPPYKGSKRGLEAKKKVRVVPSPGQAGR